MNLHMYNASHFTVPLNLSLLRYEYAPSPLLKYAGHSGLSSLMYICSSVILCIIPNCLGMILQGTSLSFLSNHLEHCNDFFAKAVQCVADSVDS